MKIEWLTDDTLRIDGIWYEVEHDDPQLRYIALRDKYGFAHFLSYDHAVSKAMRAAA